MSVFRVERTKGFTVMSNYHLNDMAGWSQRPGAVHNDTSSRPPKDLGGVPAACACPGEAAALWGYDAVKLPAAYGIPCRGAWQIRHQYE